MRSQPSYPSLCRSRQMPLFNTRAPLSAAISITPPLVSTLTISTRSAMDRGRAQDILDWAGELKIVTILAAELVVFAVVLFGVLIGVHTHDKRTQIMGIFCVIFGTAMFASPLSVMIEENIGFTIMKVLDEKVLKLVKGDI